MSVRVGNEHYALPVECVLEVAEFGDVTPVPGTVSAVIGVRNLRGQVLPVLDLAALIGLPAQDTPQRIVVAEHGGQRAGLAVDVVSDVAFVGPPTEAVDTPCLRGAAFVDGVLIGIVDVAVALDGLAGNRAA